MGRGARRGRGKARREDGIAGRERAAEERGMQMRGGEGKRPGGERGCRRGTFLLLPSQPGALCPPAPRSSPHRKRGPCEHPRGARSGGRGGCAALPGAAAVRGRWPAPGMEGHVEGLSKILRNL